MLERFSYVEKIERGMSSDIKYKVVGDDGDVLLLRLSSLDTYSDKEQEYNRIQKLYQNMISVPRPIEFGKTEDGMMVYSLTAWVEGEMLETALKRKSLEEQYLLGVTSGKLLKSIHFLQKCDMSENWLERYLKVIEPRISAFKEEGIPFEGDSYILDYFEQNKKLLNLRPQVFLHGDYHMGNMILSESNEIVIIDWEKVDFDSIGDPWYEFNRIGVEYPSFAKGQIEGYFEGNPPEKFWKLLALYISVSAITSIVWAKYFAQEELENIMSLNRRVLMWYENMSNPIPTWYREETVINA